MYYTSETKNDRRQVYCHFPQFSGAPWLNLREARRLLEDIGSVHRLALLEGYTPVLWRFDIALHECVMRCFDALDNVGIFIPEMDEFAIERDLASVSLSRFMNVGVDFSDHSHLIAECSIHPNLLAQSPSFASDLTSIYDMDWSDLCKRQETKKAFG